MSFFKEISDYSHGSITEEQAENFEEGDEFANVFFDKFVNLFNKYGFDEGTHEGLIETLYFHTEEFKYLATHMTLIGRDVTQSEFADYAYDGIMMEMQQQFEDE